MNQVAARLLARQNSGKESSCNTYSIRHACQRNIDYTAVVTFQFHTDNT